MSDVLNSKPAPAVSADARAVLAAQRTELVGEFAEAMANQFNNLMMAISCFAELELKKTPPNGRRSLEQVLSNTARATFLIQKLLAFSRKRASSPRPLELNGAIREIGDLLRQIVGEPIEVLISLEPNHQRIETDCVELEQLLFSLALNARDAMKTTGGKFIVSTESAELNAEFIGANPNASPGKFAVLCVSQTAPVPAEKFSISANPGPRMNLILSAAAGIVKEAHGLIRVSSDPVKGASFKLCFPALSEEVPDRVEVVSPKNATPARTRTILVVEDDDAVRVPAVEFLMMEGFKVLQARTGAEALRVAQQNRSPLDLLITDIVMPGLSGREVAEQLLGEHPDLKVLYMSGDAGESSGSRGSKEALSPILQKPFRLKALKEKIREVVG
jgi:CheY-like chemotaxis protein